MIDYIKSLADFVNYDFLILSFLGTLLLSISSALISPLIVAGKRSFMGAALSHSSILSLSLAYLFVPKGDIFILFVVALFITLIIVLPLAKFTFKQNLPDDSIIGVFFAVTMALGIIVHQLFIKDKIDLSSLLFGNILLTAKVDIYLLLLTCVITFLSIVIPMKKWLHISFNQNDALLAGVNIKLYHYFLFVLLSLIIISGLKIAGTVMTNALIVIPGLFAFRFASSNKKVFIYSLIFCLISSLLGLSFANFFDLPPGATIAVTQFLCLLISYLLNYNGKKSYS